MRKNTGQPTGRGHQRSVPGSLGIFLIPVQRVRVTYSICKISVSLITNRAIEDVANTQIKPDPVFPLGYPLIC